MYSFRENMIKRLFLFLVFMGLSAFYAQAQVYYTDAFRYTYRPLPTGSARALSLGGAQGALGGDATALLVNPAGIGLFRRAEVAVGIDYGNSLLQSNYLENTNTATRDKIGLSHAAAIFATPQSLSGQSLQFGISYVRSHDFRQDTYYQASNPYSSLADVWTEEAAGIHAGVFEAEAANNEIYDLASLAYATFVINPYADDSTAYYTEFRDVNNQLVAPILQEERVKESGNRSVFNITVGGQVQEKVYWGATVGVEVINYQRENVYKERLSRTAADGELQAFTLRQRYTATGGGLYLGLGVIVRPVETLRLGISVQTPTGFSLYETSRASIESESVGFSKVSASMLPYEYDFRYRSPWRATGSLFWQIKKYGFVTADVEWIPYRQMGVSGSDDNFDESGERRAIQETFRNTIQARVGAEARLGSWYVRSGVCYTPSPLRSGQEYYDAMAFTAGIGYRLQGFQLSVGGIWAHYSSLYQPYVSQQYFSPTVERKHRYMQWQFSTHWYF
jgi:hypothetical protein